SKPRHAEVLRSIWPKGANNPDPSEYLRMTILRTMITARKALLPLAIATLLCALGCSSSVSIPQWQQQVERYVREDGRGDPNVLRNMTLEGGRPGFGIIGTEDPH